MRRAIESILSKRWFPFAVIGLVCGLLWGRTIAYGFVWDDKFFIQNLGSIRSLSRIPEMFRSLDAQSSMPEGFKLFRPLRTAHYAVLYWLGGTLEPRPWLFHLANVLWHGAAAMLLYQACAGLFGLRTGWARDERDGKDSRGMEGAAEKEWARAAALVVALGFVVHPVVTEVVCWAKSLDDAMSATFALASVVALLGRETAPPRAGWAVWWYLLAVYSKVSAAPLALMVYPLLRLARRMPVRAAARRTLPFLMVAVVFMVHRRLVIGQSAQTAPISGSRAQTLLDTLATAPIYLRLVLGIPPFFIDYSFLPAGRPWFAPSVLAGAALGAGLIASAARGWKRATRVAEVLGLLWFAAFMLPVSNLLPMMQYMAERFLYLPLTGPLILGGLLMLRCGRPRLVLASSVVVLLLWSWLSWNRAAIWRDELTLFVTSSQQGERSPRVEQNAVAAIFDLPGMKSVFHLDATSGRLVPVAAVTSANRRVVEQTLAQARTWFPENPQILTASGIFYVRAGEFGRAAGLFSTVCRAEPRSADAWANLGRAELSQGRADAARESFDRALALNPDHLEALRGVSSLDWKKQDYAGALLALEKLKRLEPNNTNHLYWIEQARERLLKPSR